jgi:hypothetical protein
MYPKRSHILAPLTALTGKKGIITWTTECQKAFDQIKALLAQEAFLQYPDHNEPFEIYADASDLQLGAAIFQNNKPVAFYSRKLNSAQRNYTVGEKELLSIVETLKEFRTMLYGSPNITVYTDHKNNTFSKFSTQRVLRWRLILEDYGVKFKYIKGETNTIADALSRLPIAERQNVNTILNIDSHYSQFNCQNGECKSPLECLSIQNVYTDNEVDNSNFESFFSMAIDDDDLLDCFLHLPASSGIPFVLGYDTISARQNGDARLALLRQQHPEQYVEQLLAPDTHVVCYIPEPNAPWKIYLPTDILDTAVRWYHLALGHIGQNRLYDTIAVHFFHPDLRNKVEHVVSKCDSCQRQKQIGRPYGEAPPREASAHPWREVAVDTIGPWTLKVAGHSIQFRALTVIGRYSDKSGQTKKTRKHDCSPCRLAI